MSDTLFSSSGNAFREAVLVQYPRQGSWTIAFVTGRPGGEAGAHLPGDYLSLYVPTTPNPTSGFFLMVPRADVIALAMSVDEALEVRDLDGRRGAADHPRGSRPGANSARLSAPPAFNLPVRPGVPTRSAPTDPLRTSPPPPRRPPIEFVSGVTP